jgi:hypothetical protein
MSLRRHPWISLSIAFLTVGVAGGATAVPVAAASRTFVVSTTSDKPDRKVGDGICDVTKSSSTTICTLRAAITEANATPDSDRIRFDIETGSRAWKTIRPKSALPVITEPLVIDGTTQAGATLNTASTGTNARMRILLVGSDAGTVPGLQAAARVTIKGLVISGFARGIQLSGGADGSRVMGNFVGTDRTGALDLGNSGSGILVNAEDVRIGSVARADRNLVSGNGSAGISLGIASRATIIQGTLIGTERDGRSALPNNGDGVFVTGSSAHLIGGSFSGQGNVIRGNHGNGVNLISIESPSLDLTPRSVRILGNSISHNRGLGIDLGGDGNTSNDKVPDRDGGPNRLQNKPAMASALVGSSNTTIKGSIASRPDRAYRIEVFQGDSGDPEGRAFLGSVEVTTGSDGKATWTFRPGARLALGTIVTATATDTVRLETSEFSRGKTVAAP